MTINEVGARSGEARPKAPEWEAPGPGSWICDRSHARPGPTPLYRRIVSDQTAPVYRQVFEKYGGAVATLDMQFVNGALYRRLVPLVGADHDNGKPPPRPILWLVSRLHPAFRRRERTARHTLDNETFLDDIDKWVEVERFDWIEGNRELQAVDPADLDDDSLAAHLRTLDARLIQGWRRHHELHANDLGPIGDLLAHAEQSGMDPAVVMQLLRGESPATRDSAHQGSRIAAALRSGGVDPAGVVTVDEIRAVPGASDALDDYLDLYGWRLVTDYDISGSTLHEMSAAVCSIVRSHARPVGQTTTGEAGDAVETLRTRSDDPHRRSDG